MLAEELGAEPEEATQALVRHMRGHESDHKGGAPAQQTNIPLVGTSFLGREQEIDDLIALCAPDGQRLVTLLGMGGVGKSRLALAVGQRLRNQYRHGVWWVSLEGVQPGREAPNRLAVAIAAAMDLPLQGNESAQQQVFAHLHSRQCLLILDNSEHLAQEASLLLALLDAAHQVSLLVTSRVRMNLPGERQVTVRGLSAQAAGALFISRARAVLPEFEETDEDRPAIARICQLVEGLPLGIELAAIWTEHFSCGEIADAIAENSAFLAREHGSTVDGAGSERHDSLRAVFEHSWQLLPQSEQQVLARISVFRGEFSREAVLAISDASFSELSGLLGKSLLRPMRPGRYSSHEVVRAFSLERLGLLSPTDQAETWRRFRTHYLQQVQTGRVADLRNELENVRAAWRNAAQTGHTELLAPSVQPFADLMRGVGLLQDGRDLLQAALEKTEADLAATLLLEISRFAKSTSGSQDALAAARQGLACTGSPRLRTRLHSQIAQVLAEVGEWSAVEEAHRQQEAEARKSGDSLLLAAVLHEQAHDQVIHFVGDYRDAIRRMEEALSLLADAPPAENLRAKVLRGLCMANLRFGDYGRSLAWAGQLHGFAQAKERQMDQIDALLNLGLSNYFAGQYQEAVRFTQEGLAAAEQAGDREGVGLLRGNLCLIYRNAGQPQEALEAGQAALPVLQNLQAHRIEGQCRNRLGHTLLALVRLEEAVEMYTAALAVWQPLANPNRYEAMAGQAVALLQLNQTEQALAQVQPVLDFAAGEDALLRVVEPVQMLLHCGLVLQGAGHPARAEQVLDQAQDWVDTIAARNHDPVVCRTYRQNVPAHQQVAQLLESMSRQRPKEG